MFLTWATLRPAAVALGLLFVQMICSRLIWPTANLTLRDLLDDWWILPPVLVAMAAMLAVDLYFIIRVGDIDRRETEQYLDEAEHWLTSWKGPLIQTITLGLHQSAADGVRRGARRPWRRAAGCCTARSGGCRPRPDCGRSMG